MLEEIIELMGVKRVYDKDGQLTKEANEAKNLLLRIIPLFQELGLIKILKNLEDGIDEIVDSE